MPITTLGSEVPLLIRRSNVVNGDLFLIAWGAGRMPPTVGGSFPHIRFVSSDASSNLTQSSETTLDERILRLL
jgi:hypothetical protein